jgi:hypothetical protein
MRLALGIAVLGSACALSGCGASQRQQVQAKVEQFVAATARKDYRTLCHQVLAPALLKHLSGARVGCEQAMRIFVDSVHDPTLSLSRVTISGRTAVVIALTGAAGQRAARQAIELVRTGTGWRVAGLGSPAPTRAPVRSRAHPQTGGDQAPASSLSRPYATMS